MEGVERSGDAKMPRYDCLLFDLDDTLYPLSTGLQPCCRKNIEEYMVEVLKIDESKVASMCIDLYKSHGTTMAGLKALGYDFDNDHFHSFVHGRLPYENLRPDPVLRSLLLSMPQRKIIFTNSDKVHATKTLSILGLEDCFEGVICFETLNPSQEIVDNSNSLKTTGNEDGLETCFETRNHSQQIVDDSNSLETIEPSTQTTGNEAGLETCFETLNHSQQIVDGNNSLETAKPCTQTTGNEDDLETVVTFPRKTDHSDDWETINCCNSTNFKSAILCKPSLEAIEFALKVANADPKRTIFFDDSIRNIASGKAAGSHTVLVGSSVRTEGADFALESIHNIKEALPEIWENEEKSEIEVCSCPGITVETVVVA